MLVAWMYVPDDPDLLATELVQGLKLCLQVGKHISWIIFLLGQSYVPIEAGIGVQDIKS
jgi:hypothetical protein